MISADRSYGLEFKALKLNMIFVERYPKSCLAPANSSSGRAANKNKAIRNSLITQEFGVWSVIGKRYKYSLMYPVNYLCMTFLKMPCSEFPFSCNEFLK